MTIITSQPIDGTISKLKRLPIFHMSLSSKELFHSNFIAWLVKEYPEEMSNVFTNLLKFTHFLDEDEKISIVLNGEGEVKREERNVDLTIYLKNNKKIIIENKVKSLPDWGQLEKNSTDKNSSTDGNSYHLLLSLIDPGKKIHKVRSVEWGIITYKNLRDELNKELKSVKDRSCYVKDYVEFISLLSDLSESLNISPEDKVDFFSDSGDYGKMQKIRMHDLYHKAKYHKLKLLLDKSLKENFGNDRIQKYREREVGKIETWTNFSSATGAVNCGITLRHDDKNKDKKVSYLHFELQDQKLKLYLFDSNTNWIRELENQTYFKRLLDKYFKILNEINDDYELKSEIHPISKKSKKDPIQEKYKLNTYTKQYYYRYINLNSNLTVYNVLEIMIKLIGHITNSKQLQKFMSERVRK